MLYGRSRWPQIPEDSGPQALRWGMKTSPFRGKVFVNIPRTVVNMVVLLTWLNKVTASLDAVSQPPGRNRPEGN